MKKLFYLLTTLLFCLNLQAEGIGKYTADGFQLNKTIDQESLRDFGKAKELWEKHGKKVNIKDYNETMDYLYSKSVDRAPCSHCPEFLKLSAAVNQAIKKMPVEKVTESNLVTIRSNELEFMYVINRYEFENGKVDCKKYFDSNPMRELYEGKKEGSYRVLTKNIAEMTSVGDVQFLNPDLDEVYYYYRGKGDKKNLIYEVHSRKNMPYTISVYEYLPTEKEKNPYNLPDLGGSEVAKNLAVSKASDDENLEDEKKIDSKNYLNVEMRLEKRGKYVPKDFHFAQAGTEVDLLEMAKLKGTTKLSIKDRSSKWSLTPVDSDDEYLRFELRHKGLDELSTKVTLPYKMVLDKESGRNIVGAISDEVVREKGKINSSETNRSITLVLTDHELELIRLEARTNNVGDGMISIGHGRSLGKDETITFTGGYRESKPDGSTLFVGVQHAKKIKENTSMVLDLKLDTKAKGAIMWQVQHKF